MQKDDIKHWLKNAREFEGKGSFILGVGIVLVGALSLGYIAQKSKFASFGWMKQSKQEVTQPTPTPGFVQLEQLPSTPQLYSKNGQMYVQNLPAEYLVRTGDSTWKVALAVYGSGENYRDIEVENKLQPNSSLVVGQKIVLPDVPARTDQAVLPTMTPQPTIVINNSNRTHTVKKSEGLWQIAQQYYNDGNQYLKIYEANKDKMKNPEDMREGMVLNIP